MNIQAELSLYPLGTENIGEPVKAFIKFLEDSGMVISSGNMSTVIAGESESVFDVIKKAYENIAMNSQAVLVIKMSNACPFVKRNT